MNKNTSFSIGEHFCGFVETQVREGRYSSASDVARRVAATRRTGNKLGGAACRPH